MAEQFRNASEEERAAALRVYVEGIERLERASPDALEDGLFPIER
jgi:hypothetical protein